MGSSNISKSDSDTISNSAKYGDLEIMECSSINDGTTIKRAWIAKKSISLNDRNVNLIKYNFLDSIEIILIQNFRYLLSARQLTIFKISI